MKFTLVYCLSFYDQIKNKKIKRLSHICFSLIQKLKKKKEPTISLLSGHFFSLQSLFECPVFEKNKNIKMAKSYYEEASGFSQIESEAKYSLTLLEKHLSNYKEA